MKRGKLSLVITHPFSQLSPGRQSTIMDTLLLRTDARRKITRSKEINVCGQMHCHSCNKCFTALSLTFKRSSSAFLSGCCFGLTGKTITPELNALSRTVQTGPASRQPILNSPMDLPSISTPTNCIGAMQGLM